MQVAICSSLLLHHILCVVMTPLGSPVEPDVKINFTSVSPFTSTGV